MKKFSILSLIAAMAFLQYCSSSRKVAQKAPPKVTYEARVQSIISANCSPCHIPPGNKGDLNTYATAKAQIDDILPRIQKNPGERGFMPKGHAKLADSTIQVFVQWKADGLLEK